MNNSSAYGFWLFVLRAATVTEENIGLYKAMFLKHSGNLQNVTKEYILESIFEIIDELLLIGVFNTADEIISIINFATNAHKRLCNSLTQKIQTGSHAADKLCAIMEANACVISVLETIFIKYVQNSVGSLENPILGALKPVIECLLQEIIAPIKEEVLQYSNKFNTVSIALICRVLCFNAEGVISLIGTLGFTQEQFINGWLNKMNYIATHYGRRLNLLGIMGVLCCLSPDIIKKYFAQLMNFVLPLVENNILTKDSRESKRSNSSTLTPTKQNKVSIVKNKDMMQSERKQILRSEDLTANLELDNYFFIKYEQLCKALNVTHLQIRSLLENEGKLASTLDSIISYLTQNPK